MSANTPPDDSELTRDYEPVFPAHPDLSPALLDDHRLGLDGSGQPSRLELNLDPDAEPLYSPATVNYFFGLDGSVAAPVRAMLYLGASLRLALLDLRRLPVIDDQRLLYLQGAGGATSVMMIEADFMIVNPDDHSGVWDRHAYLCLARGGVTEIGRANQAAVAAFGAALGQDITISHQHCQLTAWPSRNGVAVRNFGRNGTIVLQAKSDTIGQQ